jgi:hypothetical protein
MIGEQKYDELMKQQAEMPPEPSPQQIAAEARIQSAQIMAEVKAGSDQVALQIAELRRQTEIIQLAQNGELTVAEIRASLAGKKMEIDSKERGMVAEAAIEQKMAREARERGDEPAGSGGNFSAGEDDKAEAA